MSYRPLRNSSISEASQEWDFPTRFWDTLKRNYVLTDRAKREAKAVSHRRFDHTDDCHFQSRRPPGANGDERFQCADCEMRDDADDKRGDDGRNAPHKEKWDYRNERADRS